jgi:hypothetical protein
MIGAERPLDQRQAAPVQALGRGEVGDGGRP